jgi:hypothetical protein
MDFVFDLNGVLVDVRKKEQEQPDKDPIIILRSGQKIYERPYLYKLVDRIKWLKRRMDIRFVIYTSRLSRNAIPIEDYIKHKYGLESDMSFYGEDCIPQNRIEMMKDMDMLLGRLGTEHNGRKVWIYDDHPEKYKNNNNKKSKVEFIKVTTYDAMCDDRDEVEIDKVVNIMNDAVCSGGVITSK